MATPKVAAFLVALLAVMYLPLFAPSAQGRDGPPSAVPGEWYTVVADGADDLDLGTVTTSVVQNGVQQTRSWDIEDMTITYERANSTSGWDFRIMAATDTDAYMSRVVYRSGADSSGEPRPGITFGFLVRETEGRNISVRISGTSGGVSASRNFTIGCQKMQGPSVKLARYFNDSVMFLGSPMGPTEVYKEEIIGIYGIGFTGMVRIKVEGEATTELNATALTDNGVAVYKWHIGKDIKDGYYNVTVEGKVLDRNTTIHGNTTTLRLELDIAEPPCPTWPNCLGRPPVRHDDGPGWLPYALGIVAVSVVAVVLFTRLKRSSLLDQAMRARIYEAIEHEQGIHFHALMRLLDAKPGVLSHHINILEREKFIKSLQDGTVRRFFLYDSNAELRVALSNIQQRILELVRRSPGIYQKDISRSIGSSGFVTNYHVRILRDAGMVTVERDGKNMRCFPGANP